MANTPTGTYALDIVPYIWLDKDQSCENNNPVEFIHEADEAERDHQPNGDSTVHQIPDVEGIMCNHKDHRDRHKNIFYYNKKQNLSGHL